MTASRFSGTRILIVGDVMLDEYVWGEVRRVSPEAPVPVVEIGRRTYVLGGAANVAANVVSLGGSALLVGVIGDDRPAELLREALRDRGVSTEGLIVDPKRPTTTKTRVVAHQQQIVRVDSESRASLSPELQARALQAVEERLADAGACVISDYWKGVVSAALSQHLICLARVSAKPVVVDPKNRDFSIYRGATVVTPNLSEAERALDNNHNGEFELERAVRALLDLLDGAALLITRGPEGMSLFRGDAAPLHIPAEGRNVFDVTGAGDTVVSALSLSLATGCSLEESARLANRAAGIVVGKAGTATVTPQELF